MRPLTWNESRPWERQPCESDAAWVAFEAWRNAKAPRPDFLTLVDWLARRGDEWATYPWDPDAVQSWADGYLWPERAEAYDQWRKPTTVVDTSPESMKARHLQLLSDAQAIAAHAVRGWHARIQAGGNILELVPRDVIRLIKDTIILERLISGEATERPDLQGVNLDRLTPDELRALRALTAKAEQG